MALFALGPALDWWSSARAVAMGLEARAQFQYRVFSVAIIGESSLLGAQRKSAEGVLRARQLSLLLRPGVVLPCKGSWQCHVGLGAGVQQLNFAAKAAGAEFGASTFHTSGIVQGSAALGYFFDSPWGLLLGVRAGALLNAPVSDEDGSSTLWGRPLVNASLALAFRLPSGARR